MNALRARFPLLDHLIRAVQRYQADAGDRLAAAVTFYWFLSLFPILLVSIYVFRVVNGDSAVTQVQHALSGYLPEQLVGTIADTLDNDAGKAGVIGLVGLVFSGLGWIDGLREAIRTVWHQNVKAGNFVVRKLVDVAVLAGLVATIGASVFVTGLAGSGPEFLLKELGVGETSTLAVVVTKVVAVALAGVADFALFVYLFVRLARVATPLREVVRGAVFGAVGFGVLKLVGAYYVQRTTTKGEATYGTFAVVVGLLLFLNLLSRVILLAAAFAVTGPGDDDTRPSGTADREQARKAGIPEEWAETDVNVQEDGAPSPLAGAVQGSGTRPAERSGGGQGRMQAVSSEKQVVLAARGIQAAVGLVLTLVAVHALKTVRGLASRS